MECSFCHQPLLPTYYYCPNCGTKVSSAPLSTTTSTQTWIYAFSIVLPIVCFLFVTRWPGTKYYKSADSKAHQIGQTAWALLLISTIFTVWFVTVWTQNYIKTTVASINSDMSATGALQ